MQLALAQRDLTHIWHPCSQMKDYETFKPLPVKKAYACTIELESGHKLIDAISSWWCKSLGHNHPRLKQALLQQLDKFEHVILANTTNSTIVALAEKLTALSPGLDKVFFAGDGSCAVEVAMKMSVHAHQLQGQPQRTEFIALANGYHGETCATMSVSDLGIYRDPYQPLLRNSHFIRNIPYVNNRQDSHWHDCSAIWPDIEAQLNKYHKTAAAIIVEPILQGAGGMLIYSQDLLKRLRQWASAHHIHLIADEIMTGFGRTGLALASQHADIEPDFLCLSKGLTSGFGALSVTLTSNSIYDLFYDDYSAGKNFLHSHTFSGNSLMAAVALECLQVLEQENIYQQVQQQEKLMQQFMQEIAAKTGKLNNIRHIGAMVAADLAVTPDQHRAGYAVYQKAVELGALLRPLGNTIYWLPPLIIDEATLEKLKDITQRAIQSTL